MNDQCPLSDERITEIALSSRVASGYDPVVVAFGRAAATAAVEAERKGQEGKDFEDALEAHHRAELGLRHELPKGHHYYVAHPLAQVEIRKDSTIPEGRAALAEVRSEIASIHKLANAAEFGDVDQSSAMTEISARLSVLYHGALSRLAASPPPPQPAQPVALTDAQIDNVLSTPIPGGSAARDWFLPHDTQKGLENVRDVVRRMLAAAPKEPAAAEPLSGRREA